MWEQHTSNVKLFPLILSLSALLVIRPLKALLTEFIKLDFPEPPGPTTNTLKHFRSVLLGSISLMLFIKESFLSFLKKIIIQILLENV